MLFLLKNTANWVVVQLLSPYWVRPRFAFFISGLWRISFDITSHPKKKNGKYMLFLLKNTANLVVVQLLSPHWVRPGFAFVISGLRRISFDITSHPKKNKKYMLFLLKKKHCEFSCSTIAITSLSSPWYKPEF